MDRLEKRRAYDARRRKEKYAHVRAIEENARLKYAYGVDKEFIDSEKKRIDNRCAICFAQARLVIDHDHATGKYRGLVCYRCNMALSVFDANIQDKFLSYLKMG